MCTIKGGGRTEKTQQIGFSILGPKQNRRYFVDSILIYILWQKINVYWFEFIDNSLLNHLAIMCGLIKVRAWCRTGANQYDSIIMSTDAYASISLDVNRFR